MKRLMMSAAAGTLAATAAFAANDLASVDLDGDNFASEAEIMAAFPGFDPADFSTIDTNDDGRISAEEFNASEARTIFDRSGAASGSGLMADADGDGFVTFEELTMVYPDFSQSDFDSIDTNDDGRISAVEMDAPEAVSLIDRQTAMNTSVSFADLDADSDGFLSYAEVAVGFPDVPQVAFDEIDVNDDSRLSSVEFNAPGASEVLNSY